ncbi:hypothetical protein UB45_03030 [Terrabacter sp. 28]|jgi:hypothetical protein|nr:hypothetical protein UB45_03030 [Terrabacter sp. 28]
MAKPGADLRFLRRKGHDLTVRDAEGDKHRATLEKLAKSDDGTQEDGAFSFGYCKSCDWTGPARRAREKARKDAEAHQTECDGKGKIRIGVRDPGRE